MVAALLVGTWAPQPAQAVFVYPPVSLSLAGAGPVIYSPITLVNLDADAALEIVVGTNDGIVFALDYNPTAKQLVKLWSHDLSQDLGSPTSVRGAASVGDLDGDGQLEVVVPSGNEAKYQGGVVALNANTGQRIWVYKTYDQYGFTTGQSTPDGVTDGVASTPALGDLNGDGKLEVVFGGFDFRVHVVSHAGTALPNWPIFVRDTVWSAPAIADLNNDGINEFVIGIDSHYEGPPVNTPDGGALLAYRVDGTLMPGFPRYIGQTIFSSVAVADLEGDGTPEIIHGTGDFYNNPTDGNKVYVRSPQGAVLWTGATNGYIRDSVAIGDLDNDGKFEVVASTKTSRLYAWHHNGAAFWDKAPTNFQGLNANIVSGFPVLADYDSDGQADVWVNTGWEVAVVKGTTGAQFNANTPTDFRPAYITANNTSAGATAVGDVTGDGKVDFVLASANTAGDVGHVSLFLLNIPATALNTQWPMYGQNARHTHMLARPTALNAEVVSHNLPELMQLGANQSAQVTLRNTGSQTWRETDDIQFGATDNADLFAPSAATRRASLNAGETIAPGQTKTFSITLTAPTANGYFTTTWRMLNAATGQWFGLGMRKNIKVGNQPALHVLTTQGVYAAGLATPIPPPTGFSDWRAAVALGLTTDNRAYHMLDINGGRWPSGNTVVLWGAGTRTNLRDIDMGSDSISAFDLRATGQIDGCDVNGCRRAFNPPIPTNIQARGIALTPNGTGVYVVDGFGTIYAGGTATPVAPPDSLPATADIFRKINVAPDGKGVYLMDLYGRIWNAGGAPPLAPNYTPHTTEDWARDFELTEDGQGFYLLDKNGNILTGGNAAPLTLNLPPVSASDIGRDIELVDGRRLALPPITPTEFAYLPLVQKR